PSGAERGRPCPRVVRPEIGVARTRRFALSMNLPPYRQVLECASPLALSDLVRGRKSGRGLPQSKTLARLRPPPRGSWSQCMRKSERRLPTNRSAELQLRQVRRRKKTLIAPGGSSALPLRRVLVLLSPRCAWPRRSRSPR